jgi:putative peptide maturation dehydrogenase
VYHAHSCWRSIDSTAKELTDEQGGDSLATMIRKRGTPPTHFPHRSSGTGRFALNMPDSSDDWLRTLRSRRTARAFRADVALPLEELGYVLHAVFGVQGIRRITAEIAAIRRTSPSAGAMHPMDAFALVVHVESLRSGLYHYEADSHSLATIEAMERDQARDLALQFVANQEYFADAHVLVIQVARFDRNFWKYPGDRKAYTSVLLDAGHLSQTLYLTATHRGLGAFFTSAINDGDIADRLGLDQLREAAVGINGVGLPDAGDDSLQFKTEPFFVDRPR